MWGKGRTWIFHNHGWAAAHWPSLNGATVTSRVWIPSGINDAVGRGHSMVSGPEGRGGLMRGGGGGVNSIWGPGGRPLGTAFWRPEVGGGLQAHFLSLHGRLPPSSVSPALGGCCLELLLFFHLFPGTIFPLPQDAHSLLEPDPH